MSRVGSVQCPIIVGRDDLLVLADRRLTEAGAGRGQLLLLAGEAGIGKTRLLEAIRRKAREAGFVAVNGSLAPQDREPPSVGRTSAGHLQRGSVLTLRRSSVERPMGTDGDDRYAVGAFPRGATVSRRPRPAARGPLGGRPPLGPARSRR